MPIYNVKLSEHPVQMRHRASSAYFIYQFPRLGRYLTPNYALLSFPGSASFMYSVLISSVIFLTDEPFCYTVILAHFVHCVRSAPVTVTR